MSTVTINSSDNISFFDANVFASLCSGKFFVDLSPTVYIGSGSLNVLGASIKIKNPIGIVIKDYPLVDYDIEGGSPPMLQTIEFPIPTQANNFLYGKYTIEVKLVDADETAYTLSKEVTISCPDKKNKTKKYGTINATIKGSCREGKARISVDPPAVYQNKQVESVDQNFTLEFPTGSGLSPLETTYSNFSYSLFEGVYKLTGEVCATYLFGDNVSVEVLYKVKTEKKVSCIIDECCVLDKLAELNSRLTSTDCTAEEISNTSSIILDTLRLLKTAQLAADCGEDASDYISELEKLLGCTCTCACNEGVPIINNSPDTDILIEGANVVKEVVGLTTIYTINDYVYEVKVNPNGNALTVQSVTTDGNTVTTVLNFNIGVVYSQIKNLANTVGGEDLFWASIVNKVITAADAVVLGYNEDEWAALTFLQRIQAIINGFVNPNVYRNGTEVIVDGSNKYVGLGSPLLKDTTIAGAFNLFLSQGKLSLGTLTNAGSSTLNIVDNSGAITAVLNKQASGLNAAVLQNSILEVVVGTTLNNLSAFNTLGAILKFSQPQALALFNGLNQAYSVINALVQVNNSGNISGVPDINSYNGALQVAGATNIANYAVLTVGTIQQIDGGATYTGTVSMYYGIHILDQAAAPLAGRVTKAIVIKVDGATDIVFFNPKLTFASTIKAPGTVGAQTISKPSGVFNIAAGQSTVVISNTMVTTTTNVMCQLGTVDATAKSLVVVEANGSFTVTLNAAATAEVRVKFFIIEMA